MRRSITYHASFLNRILSTLGKLLILFGLLSLAVIATIPGGGESISDDSAKELNNCTKISESGVYKLAADLDGESDEPCLEIIGTDSVVLDGNGFTINDAGFGLEIRGSSNVTIKNFTINNSEISGIGVFASNSIDIRSNRISNTGRVETWRNNSIHIWDSGEVEIRDNTVVNTLGYSDGVYVGKSNSVKIAGNHIENASFRGVGVLQSNNIDIFGNTVQNPGTIGWGIMMHNVLNVTARDNLINRALYGIEAKQNSTDVLIRGNYISNTTLCSIEAEGHNPEESEYPGRVSNVVIENNVIESAGPLGVWVNTSNIIVRNNTVKNAIGLGMYIQGIDGPVEIYGNVFINSTSAAIRINDTQDHLYIYENEFRQLETGLRILNTANIRIERNQFVDVDQVYEERNTSGNEKQNNIITTS